jgi:hypothetical protein
MNARKEAAAAKQRTAAPLLRTEFDPSPAPAPVLALVPAPSTAPSPAPAPNSIIHKLDATDGKVPCTVYDSVGEQFVAASVPQALNSDGTQKLFSSVPDILTRRIYPEINYTTYFGVPPF